MRHPRAALLIILISFAFLAGCSGKPPVISRVFARVVYVNDTRTGSTSETLGVFLVGSDPDGIENLSAFYVINDDADLFWKVNNTSWVSITAEGETWIGTSSLALPRSAPVPSGTYRVVLQSEGGDTVEDTFTLPPRTQSAEEAAYPSAVIADGIVKVTGPERAYDIWVYDKDGRFMASVPAPGRHPSVPVKSLAVATGVQGSFSFRVYGLNAEGDYGVLAGPYAAVITPER
jgi:hypothetical protein